MNRSFLLTAMIVCCCSTQVWTAPVAAAAETTGQATTQPSTQASDNTPLPHDPADICGQFTNGLHYLIRKNANPPGKVFLDLAVRTGSLNETDEQNGLAHFLEHMAFKGSTHYAPTRLIPMLQHLGMRFGADTNAHTNQFETVFKLTMPDTKPETLNLALTIFSDYANGLSLFPIQIESERRVILEEMRSRINVASRERKEEYNQLFPGSQMAVHDVLGDPEILKNAKAPLFVDYWNKWYRPEKMTLVVVGDVDPDAIIAQANPLLGTFAARAPVEAPKQAGLEPFQSNRAVIISDPEQITGDVEMMSLQPVRPVITTFAQFRQKMIENIAQGIVNRRMLAVINGGKAPFQSARLSSGDMLHDAFMATARAQGEPADWKKTLILLAYEIKRAVDLGFSQREWEIARDSMLAGAEQAVNVESTRDSSDLVVSLASAVDTDVPMLSSALELELLKKVVADVTVEDLQKAFIADFNAGNYAYVLKLPAPRAGENLPSEAEVLKVAASAWAIPTRATTQRATVAPLLPAEPAPGQISSRTQDSDLGVTTVVFENGVVMHHHFTDYKKDQVLVQIILPGGVLEETAENHGISSVASLILDRPATNHLSSTQIRMVLSNKNVSVTGRIGMDSLSINVAGTPGDLPIGLQLVHALLTDGKLEPPALERWKTLSQQSLRGKPMLADPQLTDALTATVMGGDPRFSAMTPETIQRQHVFKSEDWFKRIADHAAVEVSVVGDMPADQAVSLGAAYFGSLPKRTGTFADLDPLRKLTRDPGPFTRTIHYTSIEPKALVMAGFIGCEEHDPQRRPLALAALILTDRMVQRIRFDQQLVYSIRCTSTPSHGLPGTGMLSASAPTDPKNADRLADQILGIIKDFAASGPSEDELATAKKQMANQLTTQMKDPRYWLAQLSELEYHHRSLDELKQLPGIYDTFTVADLRDAVKKCATDDRLIRLEVLPDGSAATKPTTDPAAGADPSVQN